MTNGNGPGRPNKSTTKREFGKTFNPVEGQIANIFSKIHKMNGYVLADLAMTNVKLITDYWKLMSEMELPKSFHPGIVKSRKERSKVKEIEESE
jgi:hypothetical protein